MCMLVHIWPMFDLIIETKTQCLFLIESLFWGVLRVWGRVFCSHLCRIECLANPDE